MQFGNGFDINDSQGCLGIFTIDRDNIIIIDSSTSPATIRTLYFDGEDFKYTGLRMEDGDEFNDITPINKSLVLASYDSPAYARLISIGDEDLESPNPAFN